MGRQINLVSTGVAERIEEYIIKNKLKAHDKLPSERELSEMWNVNRTTLRSAVEKLINEDVLYSVSGSGNFVAPEKIDRNLWQFLSFTDTMKDKEITVKTKIISIKVIEANKQLANILNAFLGTEILEIKRLRIADEKPLDIEISYLPYNLCKGLEKYDLEKNSLYKILNDDFNIRLVKQRQDISMVYLGKEDSGLLGISERTAVMASKGITFNSAGERIEYSIAYTRADRCTFSSILK